MKKPQGFEEAIKEVEIALAKIKRSFLMYDAFEDKNEALIQIYGAIHMEMYVTSEVLADYAEENGYDKVWHQALCVKGE